MNKIKIIIPSELGDAADNFEIVDKKSAAGSSGNYGWNIDPTVASFITLIAIPSSVEGILSFVNRIKSYYNSSNAENEPEKKKESAKKKEPTSIMTSERNFVLDEDTKDEIYDAVIEILKRKLT